MTAEPINQRLFLKYKMYHYSNQLRTSAMGVNCVKWNRLSLKLQSSALRLSGGGLEEQWPMKGEREVGR